MNMNMTQKECDSDTHRIELKFIWQRETSNQAEGTIWNASHCQLSPGREKCARQEARLIE